MKHSLIVKLIVLLLTACSLTLAVVGCQHCCH